MEKTLLDEGWLNRNEIDVVLRCDQDSEKVQRFEQLLRELEKRDVSLLLPGDAYTQFRVQIKCT